VTIKHLGYDPVVYARRKKSDRSLPLIQKMLEDDPNNMVYRFYEGREFFIKKMYQDAVRSLEIAVAGLLDGEPGYFSETLKTLLSAYEQAGTGDEHVATFADLGIDKAPDQPDFWFFRAVVAFRQGQHEEAARLASEALRRLDTFELKEVSQSHPIIANNPWRAADLLAESCWRLNDYERAYPAYLRALEGRPNEGPGWASLLNNLIALAIERGDIERLPGLFEHLLSRPDTTLDMFVFRVQQLQQQGDEEGARDLLMWGRRRTSRLRAHADAPAVAAALGVAL